MNNTDAKLDRIIELLECLVSKNTVSSVEAEIQAVRLAGGDLAAHFKAKGAALPRRKPQRKTERRNP